LHRSWGPLEPFDRSFPKLLSNAGNYTHLVSDHYHYFEDGGLTYHTQFNTWDFIRGQESDPWKAMVNPPLERFKEMYHKLQYEDSRDGYRLQHMINREDIKEEKDFPVVQCCEAALAFLRTNENADNWFLQLETFDPHEPFHAPQRFKDMYPRGYAGPILEWPRYKKSGENEQELEELTSNYAAIVSLSDHYFGKLLDHMDEKNMWEDTMLIVTSDHGFMLGEHEWWGKNCMPCFNEIAQIPLIVYHPDFKEKAGEHRQALTQSIDFMPTFLDLFGLNVPSEVKGKSLLPLLEQDNKHHEALLYGIYGGSINITDGEYSYFHYPENTEEGTLFEYTLMPTHSASLFKTHEFEGASLSNDFSFTQGIPLMRLPARSDAKRTPMQGGGFLETNNVLYNLREDPNQESPINDPIKIKHFQNEIIRIMKENEAPGELFHRFDLEAR